MSTLKKVRKDAKLKNLGEEQQALLFSWLTGSDGYEGARAKCRAQFQVSTSFKALRDFFVWYSLRQQSQEDEQTVDSLIERIESANGATLSPEKRFAIGQEMFELLAIRRQDPKAWTALQQVAAKRSEHALNVEKFRTATREGLQRLLESEQAQKILSSNATNTQKIELLGKQMFGELWD